MRLNSALLLPIVEKSWKLSKWIFRRIEDWDEGIFYISNKFELDRSTHNGDLLSDRNRWKHKNTLHNFISEKKKYGEQ